MFTYRNRIVPVRVTAYLMVLTAVGLLPNPNGDPYRPILEYSFRGMGGLTEPALEGWLWLLLPPYFLVRYCRKRVFSLTVRMRLFAALLLAGLSAPAQPIDHSIFIAVFTFGILTLFVHGIPVPFYEAAA